MTTENFDINREVIEIDSNYPLMGCIAFGVIDRGTNVIQIRPTSICCLSCIFCSTDAGPKSVNRLSEFVIKDLDWLLEWIKTVIRFKGVKDIEAHIDTVGDPLTYNRLADLIQMLREIKEISVISIQTHGALLSEKIVEDLEESGLDRINLSIDAINPELARYLSQTDWYDIKRVMEISKYIVDNTKMDLLIAPVWVPKMNDSEIPKIIDFALKIGAGKKWPPLGIQKYVAHKRGRKPRGVKEMSWRRFYRELRKLSLTYGVRLKLKPEDFGIRKVRKVPILYRIGEKVKVRVVAKGWLKGEALAITSDSKRVITVVGLRDIPIDSWLYVRIISNKDNLYLARPLR